jgi:very-short-patch-repair endonuclease
MRANPTDAEQHLWYRLRRKQIGNARFRRQFPIGHFIVDFVCLPARLIVEVDGGHHDVQAAADDERTAWLEAEGFDVIRFWNNDVLGNTDGVVERILEAVNLRLDSPPPTPSRTPRSAAADRGKGRGK